MNSPSLKVQLKHQNLHVLHTFRNCRAGKEMKTKTQLIAVWWLSLLGKGKVSIRNISLR